MFLFWYDVTWILIGPIDRIAQNNFQILSVQASLFFFVYILPWNNESTCTSTWAKNNGFFCNLKQNINFFFLYSTKSFILYIHHIIITMEHDPWVTLFLPHSLLRTRGVRALPTVDRAPFYHYMTGFSRNTQYR